MSTGLQLQGDGSLGGWLPAQRSGSAGLEVVATRGVVKRVGGGLSSSKGRGNSEDDVEGGVHGERIGFNGKWVVV